MMFTWLRNTIYSVVSFIPWFNQKKGKVLLLGLDNAGKTTMLNYLKTGRLASHLPTKYSNHESITVGGVTFDCHDLGGQVAMRKIWRKSYVNISAIMFVVDCSNETRFDEARGVLSDVMSETEQTPILIFGNKTDKDGAVSKERLAQSLGVDMDCSTNSGRPCGLFMSSIVYRAGIKDGIEWLLKYM